MRRWGALAALVLGLAAPSAARAQSAIIYGSLGNFDISNDTGKVCHGFEVELDGLSPAQVPYWFSANRYGAPQVIPTATGVVVRWAASYDASSGAWSDRTVQHTVPWFPGQCYQWTGPATYESSGCEHFGAGSTANPTTARSHWLCEDEAQSGVLVPAYPPTAVPMPDYYVVPPVRVGEPPQVAAEIDAPEPAEAPELYGDAQWIRVFVTQLPVEVTLDQLVADNPAVVPMNAGQLESDYGIIQDEPAAGGNGRRKRHRNQGDLLPTTRAVVRRIELWEFTGAYDPDARGTLRRRALQRPRARRDRQPHQHPDDRRARTVGFGDRHQERHRQWQRRLGRQAHQLRQQVRRALRQRSARHALGEGRERQRLRGLDGSL
jgi:hypothetical protein